MTTPTLNSVLAGLRQLQSDVETIIDKEETTAPTSETIRATIQSGEERQDPPAVDLLDLASNLLTRLLPFALSERAMEHNTTPRDFLYKVDSQSCAPRSITEPITIIHIMISSTLHGITHPHIVNAEAALGQPHKSKPANLEVLNRRLLQEMRHHAPGAQKIYDWIERELLPKYPNFTSKRPMTLPDGKGHFNIPSSIQLMRQAKQQNQYIALTSPISPGRSTILATGDPFRITQTFANIFQSSKYPAFDGKHHSGLDIGHPGCLNKPLYAALNGRIILNEYFEKGFGNVIVIEGAYGTLIRYCHVNKPISKATRFVTQGQIIGYIGQGSNNRYAPHVHFDKPRDRRYIRDGSYFQDLETLTARFDDPTEFISVY